jgi:hypothetical protein
MAARDIQPVENAYVNMRNKTKMDTPIPDNRGPIVYNLSETPSVNGVQPEPLNFDGKKVV